MQQSLDPSGCGGTSYFIVERQYGSSEKKDRRVARTQQGGTERGGAEGSADARTEQGCP